MVLSFDRYSRDDVIGEVMLELDSIDLSNSDNTPVPIYKEITPRSYKVSYTTDDQALSLTFYVSFCNKCVIALRLYLRQSTFKVYLEENQFNCLPTY